MIEFTIETEIARPPEEVFAFATDPALLPRWQTNTVSALPLDDGPLRVTDLDMTAALDQLLDTRNQLTQALLGGGASRPS